MAVCARKPPILGDSCLTSKVMKINQLRLRSLHHITQQLHPCVNSFVVWNLNQTIYFMILFRDTKFDWVFDENLFTEKCSVPMWNLYGLILVTKFITVVYSPILKFKDVLVAWNDSLFLVASELRVLTLKHVLCSHWSTYSFWLFMT